MKKNRYIIALLLMVVVISGITYIGEAHNAIDKETLKPATTPTVAFERGTPIEYIEMPTELPASYTPDWGFGDWWVVRTEFHPPGWPDGYGMSRYKYVVVKCEEVVSKEGNQKTFYKVKRTSADKCCDDSKYWTDLYFVKDNTLNTLSLYRAETHSYHRGNMTRDVKEYGTIDNPAPVMSTFTGESGSLPVFPLTTEKRVQSFDFVNGPTPIIAPTPPETTNIYKIKQEVSVYNKSVYKDKKLYHVVGKRIFATTYKVKLTDEYGDSLTQYWHPSAPWAIYEDSATWTSTLVSCSEWESGELPKKSSELLKE